MPCRVVAGIVDIAAPTSAEGFACKEGPERWPLADRSLSPIVVRAEGERASGSSNNPGLLQWLDLRRCP